MDLYHPFIFWHLAQGINVIHVIERHKMNSTPCIGRPSPPGPHGCPFNHLLGTVAEFLSPDQGVPQIHLRTEKRWFVRPKIQFNAVAVVTQLNKIKLLHSIKGAARAPWKSCSRSGLDLQREECR